MSRLAFRNLDVSPNDPVRTWPIEAIRTALERGGLADWRRLASEIKREPWGPVARAVEEVLSHSRPYGVAPLMEEVIADARAQAEAAERDVVTQEITDLLKRSGLSRTEFARRIGTSPSRLSTYVTGKVNPSATLMVRMKRVSENS